MADQNGTFAALLDALAPAFAAAGAPASWVAFQWTYTWWQNRYKEKKSDEEKKDAARQQREEALDTKTRAMLDRAERDAENYRGTVESYRGKMETKDGELQDFRDHDLDMRALILDARQVAETFARMAGQAPPVWREIPRIVRRT